MLKIFAAILAALPIAAPAQDAAASASPGEPRAALAPAPGDGGFFVGAGGGVGFVYDARGSSATVLTLRAGTVRSERLRLALEGAFAHGLYVHQTRVDVGVAVLPFRRWLVLRGAIGLSTVADEDAVTKRGPCTLLGVGLELGRPRGATVTLNVEGELHFASAPGDPITANRGSSVTAWVGLDWY